MTIGPLAGPKGDASLGSMHRFLRLWRNRGWSMLDLDKALHALGVAALDGKSLGRLADLDRVQALTGAPLLEVLSWWAAVDTFADRPEKEQPVKSLYDRVFLNRAVDATADEPGFPLALDASRNGLAHTVAWADVRSILQAALLIDADDLALLIDESVNGLPNLQRVVTGHDATLDGLSALYRHVTLARRLKLTVSELLGFLRLIGRNPFDLTDTGATIAFVESIGRFGLRISRTTSACTCWSRIPRRRPASESPTKPSGRRSSRCATGSCASPQTTRTPRTPWARSPDAIWPSCWTRTPSQRS